jgi:CO/xanthine dehydrogenase Mo-binding subunit
VPGVLEIFSYRDAKLFKRLKSILDTDESAIKPLASSKIWHDGQIIALVVADTFEAAREGAYQVEVTYAATKPSATFGSAGTKTEAADEDNPHTGHAVAALKSTAVTIDAEYETPAQHHNPMELFSTTCVWHNKKLTIYEPSQFVNGLRSSVADQLKISYRNIRVVSKFVGGGFGSKGSTTARTALVALAARRLGRPVKLVATRDQGFTIGSYRAETRHRIRLGASRSGRLQALIHEGWELTSRPDDYFNGGTGTTCRMYAVPHVKSKVSIVHADRNMPGYMRAPAEFPYVYALETALDELAVKLRMDPIELRRINDTMSDPISGRAVYQPLPHAMLRPGGRRLRVATTRSDAGRDAGRQLAHRLGMRDGDLSDADGTDSGAGRAPPHWRCSRRGRGARARNRRDDGDRPDRGGATGCRADAGPGRSRRLVAPTGPDGRELGDDGERVLGRAEGMRCDRQAIEPSRCGSEPGRAI